MSAQGIPQIAVVMGSCTAGGAYVPAMSDETIIVRKQGTIFLGGPPLVKAATGEVVSAEELGGADVHTRISGVADHYAHERRACAGASCRRIVANLNRDEAAAGRAARAASRRTTTRRSCTASCPPTTRKPYDVREVIARIVDGSEFDEFKALLRHDAGHRLRAHLRLSGRHHRQQRHPVLRIGAEGRALHRAVLPARHPAGVPAEHHRLHGRPQVRGRRHRQGRRQDGDRRVARRAVPKFTVIIGGSYGAGNYGMCGRAYDAALPVDVAERAHLGDGRRAGGERAGHGARDS